MWVRGARVGFGIRVGVSVNEPLEVDLEHYFISEELPRIKQQHVN